MEEDSLADNHSVLGGSSDGDHHHDDKSVDAVSIRRAFIVSIASIHPGLAAPDSDEHWSHVEILKWVSGTLDGIVDEDDRISSITTVWREWEKANPHFPQNKRTCIVKTIDERLHERGFPSLRELLDMI